MIECNLFGVRLQEKEVISDIDGSRKNLSDYTREFYKKIIRNTITPFDYNDDDQNEENQINSK